MKQAKKEANALLLTSIILSILFVVGIPTIIIGASNRMFILMAFGIFFVVVGFYVMPIFWIKYGDAKFLCRVIYCIEVEHIRTVKEISMHLSKPEKLIVDNIVKAINKMYLKDYRWTGSEINKETKKIDKFKCPNCGALLNKSNGYLKCEYCNADLRDIDNG